MKIALIGYGRMGKTIEPLAESMGHEIVARFDEANPVNQETLKQADVAIEFSVPNSVISNINACFDAQVPIVVGTTAWYEHFDAVSKACNDAEGSMFYATNFSIGVNLYWEMTAKLGRLMNKHPEYRPSIHEVHHTEKLDAPSGTAITTAEVVLHSMDAYDLWKHQTASGKRDLNITHERIPEVPGTHILKFESDADCIELTHEAKGREGFALGAIQAAAWLVGKRGIYTMKDLLAI